MSVDDYGIEVLKKAAEEIIPGDKSEYRLRVNVTKVEPEADLATETTLSSISGKIDALNANVDGLEGFTDGLEALITATNGLLTTIRDNADQLESYTDGIEGLLSTTNTTLSGISGFVDQLEGYTDGLETQTGATNETAPATDTASSGLNGRLQRIAQRLTSLIALVPASLGQKTSANSFAVTVASDQSAINIKGTDATGATPTTNPVYAAGLDINGKVRPLLVNESGAIITAAIHGANSDIATGQVSTAATTTVDVMKTSYVEQFANAQRSIVSTDVNDTAAGLGARQVTIYYIPLAGTQLKTEVVTLNGTTPVNTVATDICYIEKMVVTSYGLAAANFGTINLYTGLAGAGSIFGSIAPLDNQTIWAHHYNISGKKTRIMAASVGTSGNAAGEICFFQLRVKHGFLGKTETIDSFRISGTASSTIVRPFYSPPSISTTAARIYINVTPGNTNAISQSASFDWVEI